MFICVMVAKAIIHRGRPEVFEKMVLDCAKNVRLTKTATKLFLYYAGCKNGFRPSIMEIEKVTGIFSKSISTYRKQLISRGLIGYGEEFGNMLVVDWRRIRSFAILDCPLEYDKKNPEKYFFPVSEAKHLAKDRRNSKKTLLERGRMYKLPGVDEKKDVFLHFFGNLTEKDYVDLVTSFPGYDRGQQKKLLSDAMYGKYINLKSFRFPAMDSYDYTADEQAGYKNMIDYLKSAPQGLPF